MLLQKILLAAAVFSSSASGLIGEKPNPTGSFLESCNFSVRLEAENECSQLCASAQTNSRTELNNSSAAKSNLTDWSLANSHVGIVGRPDGSHSKSVQPSGSRISRDAIVDLKGRSISIRQAFVDTPGDLHAKSAHPAVILNVNWDDSLPVLIASNDSSSVFDIERSSVGAQSAPASVPGPAVIGVPADSPAANNYKKADEEESGEDGHELGETSVEETSEFSSDKRSLSKSNSSSSDSTKDWRALEKQVNEPASAEERKSYWRDKLSREVVDTRAGDSSQGVRVNRDVHKSYPEQVEKVRTKLVKPRATFPFLNKQVDHEEYLLRQLVHQLEYGSLDSSITLLERLVQFYPQDGDYRELLTMAGNLKHGDIWYQYQSRAPGSAGSAPAQSIKQPEPPKPVVRDRSANPSVNELKQELWLIMSTPVRRAK